MSNQMMKGPAKFERLFLTQSCVPFKVYRINDAEVAQMETIHENNFGFTAQNFQLERLP